MPHSGKAEQGKCVCVVPMYMCKYVYVYIHILTHTHRYIMHKHNTYSTYTLLTYVICMDVHTYVHRFVCTYTLYTCWHHDHSNSSPTYTVRSFRLPTYSLIWEYVRSHLIIVWHIRLGLANMQWQTVIIVSADNETNFKKGNSFNCW